MEALVAITLSCLTVALAGAACDGTSGRQVPQLCECCACGVAPVVAITLSCRLLPLWGQYVMAPVVASTHTCAVRVCSKVQDLQAVCSKVRLLGSQHWAHDLPPITLTPAAAFCFRLGGGGGGCDSQS